MNKEYEATSKNAQRSFQGQGGLGSVKGTRTLNEVAGQFEIHPSRVVQWKQRLVNGAPDLFTGADHRDALEEAALCDRLYQQIGQMKVELDWLNEKA